MYKHNADNYFALRDIEVCGFLCYDTSYLQAHYIKINLS